MVQDVHNMPSYNAVKINIIKPEVNTGKGKKDEDNGIYSAVNIDIDNPALNPKQKKIYEYPDAQSPVTYDNIKNVRLPYNFHAAYHTTNIIIPEFENKKPAVAIEQEDILKNDIEKSEIEVPSPNFTTLEDEKGYIVENTLPEEIINTAEVLKPEIVPSEAILPKADLQLVEANLKNSDFDIQAQQMEEIVRVSLDNRENAIPYIVKDVFTELIDIAQADTTNLAAPTEEQISARRKVMANFAAAASGNTEASTLYQLSDEEIAAAQTISPLEQAERNKEYALYTMAILAKVYTDEVEKQTGFVMPITDIPGTSVMVDLLRYNPNAGVKVAAIEALKYIERPEYKNELKTLYTLALSETNPLVIAAASKALEE